MPAPALPDGVFYVPAASHTCRPPVGLFSLLPKYPAGTLWRCPHCRTVKIVAVDHAGTGTRKLWRSPRTEAEWAHVRKHEHDRPRTT